MSAHEFISQAEADRLVRDAVAKQRDDDVERLAGQVDLDSAWHLDKKVPVGIIAAIIIQTLGIVVVGTAWKTGVDARLERLEVSDSDRKPQESRIIIVEQRVIFMTDILSRIERKLDQPGIPPRTP